MLVFRFNFIIKIVKFNRFVNILELERRKYTRKRIKNLNLSPSLRPLIKNKNIYETIYIVTYITVLPYIQYIVKCIGVPPTQL